MASIDRPPAKGNLGSFALRPDPAASGHLPIPPRRRPLAEILADPSLGNGAKLLARYLDGLCLAHGKWAAWPKVSTIADALGWDGDPRAFRKRVERAFRELIDSGDLTRPRLGELVDWHDATGRTSGFAWPKGLRRNLSRSARVCVLGWKLAEAEAGLPSLTPCDIPVASSGPTEAPPSPPNVACDPPGMSHGRDADVASIERSKGNVRTEHTSDVAADASEGEGEQPMPTADPVATVEVPPAPAPPDIVRAREAEAWRLSGWLTGRDATGRFRDLRPKVAADGSIEWLVPLGAGPGPDAGELARIEALKPEFLAALRSRGVSVPRPPASPTPPTGGGSPAVAPRVPRAVRDRVMALIGLLAAVDGPSAVEVARAIATAIGDAKPESFETFAGYAREVRAGNMPLDALIGAFERACGRGKTNRGATLVRQVQRWKADHPGWSKGPGHPPG